MTHSKGCLAILSVFGELKPTEKTTTFAFDLNQDKTIHLENEMEIDMEAFEWNV